MRCTHILPLLFDFIGHARVQLNRMAQSMNLRAELHIFGASEDVLLAAETATLDEVRCLLHLRMCDVC
jgi:hypothetical protein